MRISDWSSDVCSSDLEKPEKPVYKPIGPDERAALSTKAVDDSGKPKGDLMTGREIENRDLEAEKELSDFMVDNNITDAKEGLIKFRAAKRAGEKKAQAAQIGRAHV